MEHTDSHPRWRYRFDNYERTFGRLREALEISNARPLTPLEKEGIIQRFEYMWELSWKLLKDYLGHQEVVPDTITPAATIRAALAAHIIGEGDVWMRALDARNLMAHTYNLRLFETVIAAINTDFLRILEALYLRLLAVSEQEPPIP